MAWRKSDGRFAGMVLISLSPDYFQKFYAELAGDLPGQSIALTRSDGTLLAIYPHSDRVGMRFNSSLQFATAYQNAPQAGTLEARSALDGKWKFFAYRRVEAHGGYVISAYPEHDLYVAWLRQMAGFSLIFILPCAALWAVIVYSLRQLSREEDAWQRWLTEATARHAMEAAWRESRKMEALGKLMGSVSHDFNNLLMVVSANVQILRRRHLTEENRYIDAIERALQTGESLTRQLLTVSRRFPLQAEIVVLPRQIQLAEQLLRSALSEKVELRIALDDSVWPVKVDPSELQVALINIAVNARDAMPYGGVFTVWAENIVLPAGGPGRSGEFVRLTLADNGPGMPESVRERVFEPLFTTKRKARAPAWAWRKCLLSANNLAAWLMWKASSTAAPALISICRAPSPKRSRPVSCAPRPPAVRSRCGSCWWKITMKSPPASPPCWIPMATWSAA